MIIMAIEWTEQMDRALRAGLSGKTRQSFVKLSRTLNVSPPSVARRAKKLGLQPTPHVTWTEAEIAILEKEWPTGASAREIAWLLPGKSRNAVIGKAHRLGLHKKETEIVITVTQKKSKAPRKRKRGAVVPQEGIMKKLNAPIRIPDHKPLTNRPPISIMELGKNTCRAIVGHAPNGLAVYCGDQTFADKSFCEGHCALFFDYDRKRRYRG